MGGGGAVLSPTHRGKVELINTVQFSLVLLYTRTCSVELTLGQFLQRQAGAEQAKM